MALIIPAIYENGVIRPLQPLALQEGQTVQIQIVDDDATLRQVEQVLAEQGLLTPPSHQPTVLPVSDAVWQELQERLATESAKPLSEIIIEERGIL